VKLKNVNTNTNAGHIADITVNDLAKLHLPCIYGKVLKLNVEYNQNQEQLNTTVKYIFPERNIFSGTFELEDKTKISEQPLEGGYPISRQDASGSGFCKRA